MYGINILLFFMYSIYFSPKNIRHSFSSNMAVKYRNIVESTGLHIPVILTPQSGDIDPPKFPTFAKNKMA